MNNVAEERAVAATILWLENVVIGLNLCPFAKAIHVKNQIRYVVSPARETNELLDDFKRELSLLVATASEQIESTLLIHPGVLEEFVEYNAFLAVCDLAIEELELGGIVQVASFHPRYQFAGTKIDDVTNYTNRSPFQMLHLLREQSVTRAVESFPNTDSIYLKNMATLRELGIAKLNSLFRGARP